MAYDKLIDFEDEGLIRKSDGLHNSDKCEDDTSTFGPIGLNSFSANSNVIESKDISASGCVSQFDTIITDSNFQYEDMNSTTSEQCQFTKKYGDKFHCHDGKPALPDKVAKKQLIGVLVFCILFIVGETTGAVLSGSLALYTDALHMLIDLVSFIISLLSFFLATKSTTRRMSFGYLRAEVIGALFSVFLIWMITGVLFYMAVESIRNEHYRDVRPNEMLITAAISVIFNIIMGVILHSDVCCRRVSHGLMGHNHSHGGRHRSLHCHSNKRAGTPLDSPVRYTAVVNGDNDDDVTTPATPHQKNINVRAAFIHVVGDFIQSVGVLIAALIIKFQKDEKYRLADPIMTFVFSLLVLCTTITILRDTLLVLMEAVPRNLNYDDIRQGLNSLNHVQAVHNLHIWALTLGKNAISAHLAVDTSDHQPVLESATTWLRTRDPFIRVTIQVENYDENLSLLCKECSE